MKDFYNFKLIVILTIFILKNLLSTVKSINKDFLKMTETTAERYARLQAKEDELARRENELKKQDVNIDAEKPNNFPPCFPFMRHDITTDIPLSFQWTIRLAFIGQFIFAGALFINFIGACTTGTIKLKSGSGYSLGKNIIFSIIFLILGIPCAFRINYMKLYSQAAKKDIKCLYFALEGIFVGINAFAVVGLKDWGLMGIITVIDALSASTSGFCKAMITIACILWAGSALLQIFLFGRIMQLYKVSGNPTMPTPQPTTNQYDNYQNNSQNFDI